MKPNNLTTISKNSSVLRDVATATKFNFTWVVEVLSTELASTTRSIQQFDRILPIHIRVDLSAGRVLTADADIAIPQDDHSAPDPFASTGITPIVIPGILRYFKFVDLLLVGK